MKYIKRALGPAFGITDFNESSFMIKSVFQSMSSSETSTSTQIITRNYVQGLGKPLVDYCAIFIT